eukprot:Platyproteum_vivax@DN7647_c1_g2_i6.p1
MTGGPNLRHFYLCYLAVLKISKMVPFSSNLYSFESLLQFHSKFDSRNSLGMFNASLVNLVTSFCSPDSLCNLLNPSKLISCLITYEVVVVSPISNQFQKA